MESKNFFGRGFIAVTAAALFFAQPTTVYCSDAGKAVFDQKCASCHAMEPGNKLSIKDRLTVKGTPLWFAGSKFQKEWLTSWLAAPAPLLGVTWNTAAKGTNEHPAVSPDEAAQLTDYLMTAVDTSVEAGKAIQMPANRSQKRKFLTNARRLFEKHQGCFSCHRYLNKRNLELGGFSAPTLVTARDRLQADWVYSFLQNPQKYYPNSKCPIPGEKAVNKFTDEDKANLAGYVVSIGMK